MKRSRTILAAGLSVIAMVISQVYFLAGTKAAVATFGNTTVGASVSYAGSGYKFGSVFPLGEDGTAVSFSWYAAGASKTQNFKPVIYNTDAAGNPTTLAAVGAETTIAINQAEGWVTAALPAIDLPAGNYYLGLLSGPNASQAALHYIATASNTGIYNANAYPTPSDPFGTPRVEAREWSFYVTYTTYVRESAPVNTALPSITGTPYQNSVLSVSNGVWEGDPISFAYGWQRCADTTCTGIVDAAGAEYTLTAEDIGHTLIAVVTATNGFGSTEAVTSSTGVIQPTPTAPVNTEAPIVTGQAQEGQTLNVTDGAWTGQPAPSYAYQWQRCVDQVCADIPGATDPTYAVTGQDVQATIQAVVIATNIGGSAQATSAPTATVLPIPEAVPTNTAVPTVTGTIRVGQSLTGTLGTWDGYPAPTLSPEWQRCLDDTCVAIDGATQSSYTLTVQDIGQKLRLRVLGTNPAGSSEAFSAQTTIVPPLSSKPVFTKHTIDATTIGVMSEKALADMNNDGKKDAVIGYRNSTQSKGGMFWYQFPASGNPADVWTKHTVLAKGDFYEDLITHDVDGDGWEDIIASLGKLNLHWYKNPGANGGVWQQNLIGAGNGENNMLMVDLDGDGKLDIASNSALFFQDSPTSWTRRAIGNSWLGMALMDKGSGNGAINFVRTSEIAPYDIVWHENPREWGGNARTDEWTVHRIGAGYTCKSSCATVQLGTIASADMNNDGRLDVVIAHAEGGIPKAPYTGVRWYEAPADRAQPWTHHFVDAAYHNVHNLRLVDMDHDGTVDIVAGEQDQSVQRRFGIFYNDGMGTFTYDPIDPGAGSHNIDVEDIENDGDWDIVQGRHGWYGDDNPLNIYIAQ